MSFISINTKQISGALFTDKTGKEIPVAKGVKSPVVMTGYIAGPREKNEDGEYRTSVYGRLPVEAALHDGRMVLSVAGGALRGVLFKADKEGAKYDYSGRIDDGAGNEYPIFGRKIKGEAGTFISLSSMDKEAAKDRGAKPKSSPPAPEFEEDDVPF